MKTLKGSGVRTWIRKKLKKSTVKKQKIKLPDKITPSGKFEVNARPLYATALKTNNEHFLNKYIRNNKELIQKAHNQHKEILKGENLNKAIKERNTKLKNTRNKKLLNNNKIVIENKFKNKYDILKKEVEELITEYILKMSNYKNETNLFLKLLGYSNPTSTKNILQNAKSKETKLYKILPIRDEDKTELMNYMGASYAEINKFLWEYSTHTNYIRKSILNSNNHKETINRCLKIYKSIIKGYTTNKEIIVFRIFSYYKTNDKYEKSMKDLKTGDTIEFNSFMSTSLLKPLDSDSASAIIIISPGSPFLILSGTNSSEREILLNPGTLMKLDKGECIEKYGYKLDFREDNNKDIGIYKYITKINDNLNILFQNYET